MNALSLAAILHENPGGFDLLDRSGEDLKDLKNRREDQDPKFDPAGTSYQLNASFESTLSSNVHRSDLSCDQISGIYLNRS